MLRQRMYYFVIYQLSGRQAGIQCDHARNELWLSHYTDSTYGKSEFDQWSIKDKTIIMLAGGTTNDQGTAAYSGEAYVGTMQFHLTKLKHLEVKVGTFYEPDLNNAMTAIAFLVDERIWDKEKYPDFAGKRHEYADQDEYDWAVLDYYTKFLKFPANIATLRMYLNSQQLATN